MRENFEDGYFMVFAMLNSRLRFGTPARVNERVLKCCPKDPPREPGPKDSELLRREPFGPDSFIDGSDIR